MIERGPAYLPTVLVVDDEVQVLESMADLLRREFHVLATSDPDEALALLGKEDVAVVLTDQRMPRLSGAELLARASTLAPETVRVLLTGYTDVEAVIQAVNEAKIYYYVAKPWNNEKILELIREAAETHLVLGEERQLLRELAQLGRETAVAALRSDVARNSTAALVRGVADLRATLAHARVSLGQLKASHELMLLCTGCGRLETAEATWSALVPYLASRTDLVSRTLCPDCTAAAGAPAKG